MHTKYYRDFNALGNQYGDINIDLQNINWKTELNLEILFSTTLLLQKTQTSNNRVLSSLVISPLKKNPKQKQNKKKHALNHVYQKLF